MAQVACVKVPATGWAKVEDLIKEELDGNVGALEAEADVEADYFTAAVVG